ncbi:S8 family serine peptidase [Pedobacter hartonius]|uniref:Subtilase family protein n=1 Tax=Pedobacter hartonius TaxID=425514 RepID=A0A1H4HIJ2_9SPHI|nr:S8 family serine peptidase [Pedobacter hartonius]SEB21643.1 Subtilase family protein [Pedobacter hartonius]
MKQTKYYLYVILVLLLFSGLSSALAQQAALPKSNWQNLDLKTDGVFGMSTEKAYLEILKEKKVVPVVVAIIDGGVDIEHEDLKPIIWTNSKEIAGNGKDDDGNGYIDDVHGWNFLGSSKGSFHFDNIELVRLLRKAIKKDSTSDETKRLQTELDQKIQALKSGLNTIEYQRHVLLGILKKMGKPSPTEAEFRKYHYQNDEEAKVLILIVRGLKDDAKYLKTVEDKYNQYKDQIKYLVNINYDPRAENPEYKMNNYGNENVKGSEPSHGTHVAGIIAAIRDNGLGIKGVAAPVQLMVLRTIPEGDALDSEVANSIRYAVDNGAKVINISISKMESPQRQLVDEAVQYAMEKDVLVVHSAGNDGKKEETESDFPRREYEKGGMAEAWIEVGASGWRDDESLLSWFTNYGKQTVDVFAPGVAIFSTFPENNYKYENGTSMATPMVSGLAALIRAYYPKLTAVQIKNIILKSVIKINHKVKSRDGENLNFSELCSSGGIVNVYSAMRMVENIK